MRVAFDLDGTLIPERAGQFSTEEPGEIPWRWFVYERIRTGAPGLFAALRARDVDVWVYTSSLRRPWEIRALFRAYGVALGGVVNADQHEAAMRARGARWGTKHPPAFGIDLLVDDSEAIVRAGTTHGFRVVHVTPDDASWCDKVMRELG
jgi:hypothetical protein